MTDVETNSCTIRGYCSRFKVVLAFVLAAAAVSDGEIVGGSDFKFDFLPPASARSSPSILLAIISGKPEYRDAVLEHLPSFPAIL